MTPDEKRAYHREYKRLRRADPEYRARLAAAARERYQSDPEYRDRVTAAVAARRHADPEKARLESLEHNRKLRETKPDYHREWRAKNPEYVERERERRRAAHAAMKRTGDE